MAERAAGQADQAPAHSPAGPAARGAPAQAAQRRIGLAVRAGADARLGRCSMGRPAVATARHCREVGYRVPDRASPSPDLERHLGAQQLVQLNRAAPSGDDPAELDRVEIDRRPVGADRPVTARRSGQGQVEILAVPIGPLLDDAGDDDAVVLRGEIEGCRAWPARDRSGASTASRVRITSKRIAEASTARRPRSAPICNSGQPTSCRIMPGDPLAARRLRRGPVSARPLVHDPAPGDQSARSSDL